MGKLNYKSGLLYLYWLMSGADGMKNFDPDDPEWKIMKLMRDHEDIGDSDFDNFINSDLGSSEDQLSTVVNILKDTSHDQKVNALAWMDLVMIADGNIHNKEYELYSKVRQKLNIEESEIKAVEIKLPKL
ncbi:MAG: hypothetical protein AUJ98_07430 [Bacteroidetes bacterium CG2_30_33_31]|nr:MAG: hypothetical protein AUJ98_07430 [Bacteroidetes bacterium CG2_30_33_31]